MMHPTQKSILQLFGNSSMIPLRLRWIAREIDEVHPQSVKHHLQQLEKDGLVVIDIEKAVVIKIRGGPLDDNFVQLPIMGIANCGSAIAFAEDQIEGFLKISRGLLQDFEISSLFVLKARGDSMNKADINGRCIEDGDFVLIDKSHQVPNNGEHVVSIINGCANIKRYYKSDNDIALVSESTKDYSPIFIDMGDQYHVSGKVVKVIKKPKFSTKS